MARLLLGVTGSVAAIRTPLLIASLLESGHSPRVIATERALHFFDHEDLLANSNRIPDEKVFLTDRDEWEGSAPNHRYQRGDKVLHIELGRWADLLIVAPLDANTLGKFALGLTDGCLCSLWRAWNWEKPVVLAPAMNSAMWNHPATRRHILGIVQDSGLFFQEFPTRGNALELVKAVNAAGKGLFIVPPISKLLACGDEGIGAMGEISDIVRAVTQLAFPD